MAKKDLETTDDLRQSIAHVDEVSARIARLLAELTAPKPAPVDEDAPGEAPADV